jgi:hypothetical protein
MANDTLKSGKGSDAARLSQSPCRSVAATPARPTWTTRC